MREERIEPHTDTAPRDVTTVSEFGPELLDHVFEQRRNAVHHGVVS